LERLKGLFGELGPDYRIVVYLRRQDQHVVSNYSTAIKTGGRVSFEHYLARRSNKEVLDYAALLDRWSEVFGKRALSVNTFEKACWKNEDIVDDFCARIGLEDLAEFERPEPENTSLDPEVLEFGRLINRYLPKARNSEVHDPIRGRLRRALESISSTERLHIDTEQARAILDRYEESNKYVAMIYLNRPDGILFREPVVESKATASVALTVERTVELAAKLWMHQQGQQIAKRNTDRSSERRPSGGRRARSQR
jgi:hypothetical protein